MNTENKLKIDDFTKALAECIHQAQGSVFDPMVHAELWENELVKLVKSEEPVSDNLEEAAYQCYESNDKFMDGFKKGANWKEKQLEKNRLKHCDSITNEQAELEQGFIDQHLDKYQRMPTYLDAVEYGMRLQKEQMMKGALNGKMVVGDESQLVIPSLPTVTRHLDDGDKVKVIVIKEA